MRVLSLLATLQNVTMRNEIEIDQNVIIAEQEQQNLLHHKFPHAIRFVDPYLVDMG
jgi:hypothetical protein